MAEHKLEFFLNKKKHIVVISFLGIAEGDSAETLYQCQTELIALEAKYVIFNMAGVIDITRAAYQGFVLLQTSVRDQSKKLITCAFTRELKATLIEDGVIRPGEIEDTLMGALQRVVNEGEKRGS